MKAFGIGCLHFSFKSGQDRKVTVQQYVEEVVCSLEKLSTVSNVEMSFDQGEKTREVDASECTHMNDGDSCHPYISFYDLSFNIYLPKRIQSDLIGDYHSAVGTGSESFRVVFRHDWHGPFTVVETIGSDIDSSPSTAIQVVREYLKREFSSVSNMLTLDFVGPSPFHADFFLVQCEEDNFEGFRLNHNKSPGYDEIVFEYSTGVYESEEIAFESLLYALSCEVAFFYELRIMSSKRINDWEEIQEKLHELLHLEDEEHKKTLKERYSIKPKLLNGIYRDIGLFKGQEIYQRNIYEQHYFSVYKSEKQTVYLKPFVEGTLENWKSYPVQEVSEIVNYFEGKSNRATELTVAFLAAVLGGAIGAAITVLFDKG